jgi:two-component system OmpR family response regulator
MNGLPTDSSIPEDTPLAAAETLAVRLLIAEDDLAMRDAVFRSLRDAGHTVVAVPDGAAAMQEVRRDVYDLLVLDLDLPQVSGREIIKAVRATGSDVPIIVITGYDSTADRIAGLDSGADDYIVKPFPLSELHARIRALLRRSKKNWNAEIVLGDLTYDRTARSFSIGGAAWTLSRRESEILEALVSHAGELVRKEALAHRLSRWDQEPSPNLVEVYVHKLRKRLAPMAIRIETVRGLGYILSLANKEQRAAE